MGLVDCLNEAIPDIFGALLSAKIMGEGYHGYWDSDDESFTNSGGKTCWGYSSVEGQNPADVVTDARRTKWRNWSKGLGESCSPTIPFSHRSYYDYLPCTDGEEGDSTPCDSTSEHCESYETCLINDTSLCKSDSGSDCYCGIYANNYINRDVWQRFIRLLADGSYSLADDGFSEDICDVDFYGVDRYASDQYQFGCAADIVWAAVRDYLEVGDGLAEWIGNLIAAASVLDSTCHSALDKMERALEATGLPEIRRPVNSISTVDVREGKISGTYWNDWVESQKYLWAYIGDDDGKIRVNYMAPGGSYSDAFISDATNVLGKPSIAVFKDVLYVVWTYNSTPPEVRYRYMYESGGTWYWSYVQYLPQDKASPAGQVAVAADDTEGLAIVYVDSSSNKLSVTRCTESDGICEDDVDTDWSDGSPGGHNYYSKSNLAAVWARNVNGVDSDQVTNASLYVLGTVNQTSNTLRLYRGYFGSSFNWDVARH